MNKKFNFIKTEIQKFSFKKFIKNLQKYLCNKLKTYQTKVKRIILYTENNQAQIQGHNDRFLLTPYKKLEYIPVSFLYLFRSLI